MSKSQVVPHAPGVGDEADQKPDRPTGVLRRVVVGVVVLAVISGAAVAVVQLTKKCEEFAPGASLVGCTFTDGDFADLDLTGADFTNADLSRADFTGATLTQATLTGAILVGANLTDADATGAVLQRADLSEATLTRTTFSKADLTDVVATASVGPDVKLFRANLTRADFTRADLGDADLRDTTADAARFDAADLSDARFGTAVLTGASFRDALLGRADFNKATADGAVFVGASAERAVFDDTSLVGADLSGINLSLGSLYRSDLTGATLAGATLRDLRADKSIFTGADLTSMTITSVSLSDTVGLGIQQLAVALGVGTDGVVAAMVTRGLTVDSPLQVARAAAAARDGEAIPGAAPYTPGPGYHPIVALDEQDDVPADWSGGLRIPPAIAMTELVAVPDTEEVIVEVCRYRFADGSTASPINRVRYRTTVTIVAAATGESVATRSFEGGEPRLCEAQMPSVFAGRTFFGVRPDTRAFVSWLDTYVHAP